MKKIALTAAASMAALIAIPALAQPGGQRPNPDSNGDGIITRAEVNADVAKRFARMDVNKDGKLNKADREAAMAARGGEGAGEGAGKRGESKRGEGQRGDRAGGMMRADSNGDGAVTLAEMQAAAAQRFDRADADNDGKLTQAERDALRRGRGGGGEGGPGAPPPPAR